jgi:hypothetical protein
VGGCRGTDGEGRASWTTHRLKEFAAVEAVSRQHVPVCLRISTYLTSTLHCMSWRVEGNSSVISKMRAARHLSVEGRGYRLAHAHFDVFAQTRDVFHL